MLRSRLGAALAAAAMVLAACSEPPAKAPTPDPLSWSPCEPKLECATVTVPLEYTDPDGEQIPLAVMRHRATNPAQRIGALFFNPGGPGVAATDTVTALFSPDILARFDIIAMDPRGVGRSRAVRCLTDEQRAAALAADLDANLPGGKPLPQLIADAKTFTKGCAQHQSREFLASLSTDNVARDMDQVREAIGEDQITYYGVSYGTVVGPTYATLFPDRVRQMVIDAPVDTEKWRANSLEFLDEVAVASERTLDAWLAACRAEKCPFDTDTLDALIVQLEARPLKVEPVQGLTPGGTLDGAKAREAIRAAAGAAATWPVLTAALLAAQQGNGTPLLFLWTAITVSPFPVPTAGNEVHNAVRCVDWSTPTDVAAHTAAAAEVQEHAKRIGTEAAYAALNCAFWPTENKDRYTEPLTAAGAPPILVIGGRLDPVTPHHWAEAVAHTLHHAVLLTREGVGHGSYRSSGSCVDTAVDEALISKKLPTDGTVCQPDKPATTIPTK
ncbi:alpha/beta hydrolase [Cryptosporangium sp. NPDC048952]|uniref:alpha/beta hydrolase n=1 Tax=Cryptosporangium sp. NPDC048952 TaxID=3363961 RepID=UPI0037134415